MDQLERYLQSEYLDHKVTLADTTELAAEVAAVFDRSFLRVPAAWPYELISGASATTTRSMSTAAMISFALSLATGRIRESSLVGSVRTIPPAVTGMTAKAVNTCVELALAGVAEQSKSHRYVVDSRTFGTDDPFTLTWLLESLTRPGLSKSSFVRRLEGRARTRLSAVLTQPGEALQLQFEDERVSHSFPLLRFLHLRETLLRSSISADNTAIDDVSVLYRWFARRIDFHLARSRTKEGGFDVADMMFALEGWILASPTAPSPALVDDVFSVLREVGERATPPWRPVRPFKATSQGLVLLPQSVEVANTILRICSSRLLESRNYFSAHFEMIDNYRRWLMASAARGVCAVAGSQVEFVGWESENTHKGDRIHLWETSQVMIFLQHFAGLLQQHIATTSLDLAGFKPERVARELDPITNDPLEPLAAWKRWSEDDPFGKGPRETPYRVYQQIRIDFIEPRLKPSSRSPLGSMLLYGPPGTGKSTFARRLAAVLDYPVITITPSDFITSGGEAVEARATAIFKALREQSDLVVLFDEIDNLLLDRDSKLYREQGDVFKLLTPGMLTKLADLTSNRRVVLVIATNYYERIDRAIKRPGRIDARYLVLPPMLTQRIRHLTARYGHGSGALLDVAQLKEVAIATARFTYREIDDLAHFVAARHADASGASLARQLVNAARAARPMANFDAYLERLTQRNTIEHPWEEFALVAYLQLEASRTDLPEQARSKLPKAIREANILDTRVSTALEREAKKAS